MKLAIFGSSPIALEAALRFNAHEASLTWFNGDEMLSPMFESSPTAWSDVTSELGWETLKQSGGSAFDKENFSWEKWFKHYYLPLAEYLKTVQEVKPHKVLSVTKRFLASEEEIKGSTRFLDLFRVIYQLNPEEFINQQKESNPETYERLSEEFVQSLQSSLEMYEDFDLVIDLRDPLKASSLAVSGRALGEGRVSKDKIYYGIDALKKAGHYVGSPDVRELCLVGSGDVATEILLKLESWLKDIRSRLFIVSAEADPFQAFLKGAKSATRERVESLFNFMNEQFQSEINEFHQKLREWQELDDFIQAKMPRPAEPIPRLVFFSGHNVTAVDQLIDKRRLFVTIEKPEFREGIKQPENNHLDLKTIGVDEVLVANSLVKENVREFLRSQEIGYYDWRPQSSVLQDGWKEDINALTSIEENIFKLFSPASR